MNNQYYECRNCGQVAQGFHAAQAVACCNDKEMVEIDPDVEDTEEEE